MLYNVKDAFHDIGTATIVNLGKSVDSEHNPKVGSGTGRDSRKL